MGAANYSYLKDITQAPMLRGFGVYMLEHIPTGKRYIGGTSVSFSTRMSQHLYCFRNRTHHCEQLQELYDKDGIENIKVQIILSCADHNTVSFHEKCMIQLFQPELNRAYLGKEHLPTTRVYRHNKYGEVEKEYPSITSAARINQCDEHSIHNAASGKRPSAGGWFWSFDGEFTPQKVRVIRQYDKMGAFIRHYDSLEDVKAALKIGTSTAIRNCFRGVQHQAYGYIWTDAYEQPVRGNKFKPYAP